MRQVVPGAIRQHFSSARPQKTAQRTNQNHRRKEIKRCPAQASPAAAKRQMESGWGRLAERGKGQNRGREEKRQYDSERHSKSKDAHQWGWAFWAFGAAPSQQLDSLGACWDIVRQFLSGLLSLFLVSLVSTNAPYFVCSYFSMLSR